MKKVLFGTLVFIAANCFAQDPRFRQFYSSGLNANPAFAGAYEYPEVSLMYRNEWPSLNVNHNSYFLSYNQYMNKLKGGLGLYYMHETEEDGVYNTNSFHLDYSPSFSLDSNWVLKPAFEISFYNKTIDLEKFYSSPRYTPSVKSSEINFLDYSAGLLLYEKNLSVGFAIYHLTEPEEGFFAFNQSPLPKRFTAHTSANIPLNKKESVFISPGIRIVTQSEFGEVNFNLACKIDRAVLGVSYHYDAFDCKIAYDDGSFRLSYSYDASLSKLRNTPAGSHEFFVAYFIKNEKLKSRKTSLNRVVF